MPSGTWPEIKIFTHRLLAHLSDWQAKYVEDASVGKVEGPDECLAVVGGRGGVRRVEEHSVFAQQRIQLLPQAPSSPLTISLVFLFS